ncbi:hypothetical protein TruAng_004644 [Truncatella angustata]|nr:hypothetical protein TruAng_004644 [Truncatella angustata]
MSATVVLGSGIIGVSTAYYLSKHQPPSSIHLVEPSPELFASASGYAGGFLAKDWFPAASASLGALSFDEHRKLAEKGDGASRWGYTKSTSISLSPGPKDGNRVDAWSWEGTSRTEAAGGDRKECVAPPWLRRGEGDTVDMIGEEGTVAQVATSVQTDMRNEVSSIRIEDATSGTETDVPCTTIIITAGAWSPQVFKTLFPTSNLSIPISNLAGHSLVVKSPHWVKEHDEHGCHAIFMASQSGYSPEVFSRIGGHIYIAGLNSATEPLPPLATDSKGKISKSAIEQLLATAREVIGQGEEEHDLEIVKEGLCFRPVTTSGLPIIGRIPDNALGAGMATRPGAEGGVYLAAGHGPWGISLCLGTGKVLAEMVQGRSLSADVSRLGLNGY